MGGGGRGGRARTQRRHFREKRENVWKNDVSENSDDKAPAGGWQPFATQNPAFDDYYKGQGIVLPEEWDKFMEVIRKPLPAAFRVNSSSQFCANIRSQLENDFMKSLQFDVTDEGELEGVKPLAWYPENLAWQSNYSRMQLRKTQTLERFHEFLKQENEIGNITRQEAVSMVPPLFLDVHPDHFILDMCAAPGSKTFQLLEIIHQSSKPGILPAGMIVANDVDVQRCNLLIHQTKRMCTANLMVTNHDAQNFPSCRFKKNGPGASDMGVLEVSNVNQLLFDRVLCDVPCSGDGTLRKAPDIWRKWNVGMGNGIHSLQVKIAMRGLALLKVGGRMVYSTCSMNPVENEAVVAEILRRCEGAVELVDVSSELPQLVRRPGLKKWRIRDKGTWLASYKDVPKYRMSGIFPSMFPSGRTYPNPNENGHVNLPLEGLENGENGNSVSEFQSTEVPMITADISEAEVSDLPLERSMRIMPHDQNSGAFFIAVLHKISALPAIQEKSGGRHGHLPSENGEPCKKSSDEVLEVSNELDVNPTDDTEEISSELTPDTDLLDNIIENKKLEEIQAPVNGENLPEKVVMKRKLHRWRGVDPILFFKDEVLLDKIKSFYGIDDSLPFDGHLVTRNSDNNRMKRIYYISKAVKDILHLNFLVGQQLKITSIGLKMFERQSSKEGTSTPCSFRISSEGLPVLLPYITKQILRAPLVDFKNLLQYKSIKFRDFVDTKFGEEASKLMMGCCVLILKRDDEGISGTSQIDTSSTIAIGCWKGRGSITVMVTAVECQELLERQLGLTDAEKETMKAAAKKKPSNLKEVEHEPNNAEISDDDEAEEVAN